MIYYRCDVKISNFMFADKFDERMTEIRAINKVFDRLNSRDNADYQMFLHDVRNDSISFDFSAYRDDITDSVVCNALKELGFDSSSIYVKEISEQAFTKKLRECLGVKYIHDDSLIRRLGGKAYLCRMHETPIKDAAPKAELIRQANDLLCGKTLVPEIERIYASGNADAASGHPAHYIVKSDDIETCEAITRILLNALAGNNRLYNKNSCRISIDSKFWTHDDHTKTLRAVSGGAAVILCHKERYERDNSDGTIKQMCDMLSKYNRNILFIFQMPANSKTAGRLISRNNCGITFVTITEETLTESEAFQHDEDVSSYLRRLAETANVVPTEDLYKNIEYDREYHAKELRNMFDQWNNGRLKREVFPQYAELE